MKGIASFALAAAALAAATWFGVPCAQPRGAQPRGAQPRAGAAAPVDGEAERGMAGKPAPKRVREADAERGRETGAERGRETGAERGSVAKAGYAPGYEPRVPGYAGPRYDWGVLAEDAQAYAEDGKPRAKLTAGTVVEKMAERSSKSGPLFVCRILSNRRWQEGFLLPASAVVMFEGPFASSPKGPGDKVIDYFTKVGQRERRLAALKERHLRQNPYFSAYQTAAKAYLDFQQRAKELTAGRDAAVGVERSRLVAELTRMKNQEPRLRSALEKAEVPYKKWKAEHGDGSEAAGDDPEIAALDREIEALVDDVSEMVPGI